MRNILGLCQYLWDDFWSTEHLWLIFFSRLTDGYQVLIHTEKTNVCDGIKDASPVEVLRVSTADGSFYEPWGLDGFTSGFDWNSCSPQVLLKPNFHQDTWLRRSWADSAVDSPFETHPDAKAGVVLPTFVEIGGGELSTIPFPCWFVQSWFGFLHPTCDQKGPAIVATVTTGMYLEFLCRLHLVIYWIIIIIHPYWLVFSSYIFLGRGEEVWLTVPAVVTVLTYLVRWLSWCINAPAIFWIDQGARYLNHQLVGALEHVLWLSIHIGNVIIPTVTHSIIFRMSRSTTNQYFPSSSIF